MAASAAMGGELAQVGEGPREDFRVPSGNARRPFAPSTTPAADGPAESSLIQGPTMIRFWKSSLALVLVPVGLFLLAGRPVRELFGLVRASADAAVDGVVDGVPDAIVDRKLDSDVQLQRRQLTDHQVALNLSRREVDTLTEQVKELEERGARRKRLLSEAYPVLQQATVDGWTEVEFAGGKHTLAQFQGNLDQLLAEEEREQRQLEIRRAGLAKLTTSVTDGERALSDMRDALLALEQEIDLLRLRRDQAELEGRTLEVVSAVGGPGLLAASTEVGAQTEQLREQVGRLEATNEALRTVVPSVSAAAANRVARDWERIERLKALRAESGPAATGGDAAK